MTNNSTTSPLTWGHSHTKQEISDGQDIVTWDGKTAPKIKELSEQEYNDLQTKDPETLYIIPEN